MQYRCASIKTWWLSREISQSLSCLLWFPWRRRRRQLILQQMTSDLNKMTTRSERLSSLWIMRSRMVWAYKDAVLSHHCWRPQTLLSVRPAHLLPANIKRHSHVTTQNGSHSRILTFDSRSLCCRWLCDPRSPLLVIAKWSFVTPTNQPTTLCPFPSLLSRSHWYRTNRFDKHHHYPEGQFNGLFFSE